MKHTLIAVCAFAVLLNTGCTSTKSTTKNNTSSKDSAAIAKTDEKLPPVAEAPSAGAWGRNISPYAY